MMNMILVVCSVMLVLSSLQVDTRHVFEHWSLDGENKMSIMEALSQDSFCRSCLEVSSKAAKTLSDPKMFQGIGTLSNEVCHVLPPELQAQCSEVSNAYIHHSRLFLQELFHEKNLCNSTGICGQKSSFSDKDLVMNPIKLTDSKNCLTCRNSVKEILSRLKLPNMRMKIMEALIEYCEEVDENEAQCKRAVYSYAPLVLSKLENLKPNDMCRMVGLCDEGISL
ncbi:putative saposin B type, region 2 [Dioscorea sansibarensis]